MTEVLAPSELVVGSDLSGPTRVMTKQRMVWYGDGLESAVAGKFTKIGINIHTNDDFARSQGLPGVIADGMHSTNWISNMLIAQFGMDYIGHGELRTKFIKPVYENVLITPRARVQSVERLESGAVVYSLEVWCEDQDGVKLTVGDAKVEVAPRG